MANQRKKFSFSTIVQKDNGKKSRSKTRQTQGDTQTPQLKSEQSISQRGIKRTTNANHSVEIDTSNNNPGTEAKKTKKLKADDSEVILISEDKGLTHEKKKKCKAKSSNERFLDFDKNKDHQAVVIDVEDTDVIEIPDDDIVLITDEDQIEKESCEDDVIEIESDPEIKKVNKYGKKGKWKKQKDRGSSRSKDHYKKKSLEQMDQPQSTFKYSDDERLDYIRLEDGVLLVLNHPHKLALAGSASLQCVLGSIEVLGFEINLSHSEVDVYSPPFGSCLTITTRSSGTNKQMVVDHLKEIEEANWKKLEDILEQIRSPVIIKIKNSNSPLCSMKTYKSPFSQVFRTKENSLFSDALQPLGVSIYDIDNSDLTCVRVGEDLQSLLMEWNSKLKEYSKEVRDPLVMVICGSKNTGKSTTNRLLINNALNSLDYVYFLDCDIGQSEFTPPGCVSLVKVAEPVMGPPFTHQRKPECSCFYGGLTPQNNPDLYIGCLVECVKFYRQLEKSAPLIVNTMGWIEDLGLQLLIDTVRLVIPTHVVQLQSKPGDEMIEKLFEWPSWTDTSSKQFSGTEFSQKSPVPKCLYIKPRPNNREFKSSNARELRDLTVLGYFYKDLEPGLTMYSVSPHCVMWKDVAVHVSHHDVPPSQIMYTLNASLVALCHADLTMTERPFSDGPLLFKDVPIFSWKGYGLVRGIDMEKKLLYIVTPLSLDELQTVNTIVKGSVMIPEQVLVNKGLKDLPYVDARISSFGEKELRPKKKPKMFGRPKH